MAVSVPSLPALGLGCAKIGSFGNPSSLGESIRLIREAVALGVTLLDTANIYGQGDSERAIGRAMKGARDKVVIVTKGGMLFSARMRMIRPFKPLLRALLARRAAGNAVTASRESEIRTAWSPRGLTASLDGSLRRLGTDRVDAFLLHSPPAAILARPESADALAEIRASGRALRVGAACDDLASLDAALSMAPLDILELPWDVLAAIEGTPRAAAIRDRGIAVIAREVLRFQPGVPAETAFARARAMPLVSTTLIGSRRIERVRALAAVEPRA